MTVNEFLENMIDTGYVKVKAKELREFLQDYRERENIMNQQAHTIQELSEMVSIWKNKYDAMKIKEPITIDLKV